MIQECTEDEGNSRLTYWYYTLKLVWRHSEEASEGTSHNTVHSDFPRVISEASVQPRCAFTFNSRNDWEGDSGGRLAMRIWWGNGLIVGRAFCHW